MSVSRLLLSVAALSAIGLFSSPALAKSNGPHWEEAPLYTTVELDVGFDNDPRTVKIEAGGDRSIEHMGAKCGGYVNWEKPDVDINYANEKEPGSPAGDEKLSIYVKSEADTTLLIYTPDRKWVCGDDISDSNLNPVVTFARPLAGNYNIWVGTFEEGEEKPATIYITEENPPKQ